MPHGPGEGSGPPPNPNPPHKHKKPPKPKPPKPNPARQQHNHPDVPTPPRPPKPRRQRRRRPDPLLGRGVGVPKPRQPRIPGSRTAAHWLQQHNARSQAVMHRQMVLRAAGYNVAVDGVWGPASQNAWYNLNHGNIGVGKHAPAPYAIPKGQPFTSPAAALDKRGYVEAARAAARQARAAASDPTAAHVVGDRLNSAHDQAQAQLAAQQAAVTQLAHRLATNPHSSVKLTLHQLTNALTDPQGGVDPTSHAGATAAQVWLNSHGYHVKATGSWDKQTHDAFTQALHDEQRRIEDKQNRTVLTQLYSPNGLHPGDHAPDWLPLAPGERVPQPGELLHMLQGGGFRSSLIYNALTQHAGEANWRDFQHTQLLRLAAKLQPFAVPLHGFGLHASNDMLYANLIDTVPGVQMSPYGGKYGARDQGRRVAQLLGQVKALYRAKNPGDFKSKLAAFTQQEERIQIQREQQLAAHHVGWFGHAMHAVMLPGEYTRTAIVAGGLDLKGALDGSDLRRIAAGPMYAGGPGPHYWSDAQQTIENMPLIPRLAFEMVVDPLNLVGIGEENAVFRLGSTTLKYATKGEALGAYVLMDGAKAGWKGLPDMILGRSLRYQAGTWTKGDAATYLLDAVSHRLGGVPFTGSKAENIALRALVTKQEALAAARESVAVSMRHGFQNPRYPTPEPINVYGGDGKLIKQLDSAMTDMIALHDHDPSGALAAVRDILTRHHASLWLDAAKKTLSNVGASIEAYIAETLSAQIAHRLAGQAADKALAAGLGQDVARAEAEKVLEAIGTHLGPKGSDALPDELKLILKTHRDAVNELMDTVRNTWFHSWQRMVEDAAQRDGVELFDKKGLWSLRHGDQAETLRALARDTFETGTVKVRNPNFGIPHTFIERNDAVESEVGRLVGRAQAYDRRMTVGQYDSNFNALDHAEQIHADVSKNWVEDGGFYYDRRSHVEVSSLYARRLGVAREMVRKGAAHEDFLAHIAQAPGDVAIGFTPLNDALDRFAWRIGGRGPSNGLENALAGSPQYLADAARPSVVGKSAADVELEFAARMESTVKAYQQTLAKGYDAAMPYALRDQLLLWQALNHAQSLPLRILAKTLNAGLSLWIFATLPLRPGWTVRNVIDNWSKAWIAGCRDPRMWFLGAEHPGSLIRSVFDVGIYPMKEAARFLDQLFGTDVYTPIEHLLDQLWEQPASVLRRVFDAQGIDAPEHVIADMQADRYFRGMSRDALRPHTGETKSAFTRYSGKAKDALWETLGNRPENYWRRIIYRDTIKKETKRLAAEGFGDKLAIDIEAHRLALKKIEDTLFDYSTVTVVEDNLRVFIPFIQFWRKNTVFWAGAALSKPWLPAAYGKWEQALNDSHSDLPEWMRRYVSSRELSDAASVVPGLDNVVNFLIPQDVMYDPLKFSSGAPLYRSFLSLVGEQQDPNLPPGEGNGWKVIGPMLNAMNEWGLGINPLIEKPLEYAGVASLRSWQTVFPQAGPIIAHDPQFWLNHTSNRIVDWARIAALTAMGADPNAIAKNYDYYIQQEIADQVARGEQPDRAKATKTIQDWFWTQNMVGYFTGMYLRRATPSDIYMSKLYDDALTGARKNFTGHEQNLLKLWAMRGADRLSYNRYLENVASIQAYYRQPDYASSQAYLDAHPELQQYVDPTWRGQPFSHNYVKQATLRYQADQFFRVSQLSDQLDVAFDVRKAAEQMLLTPEIQQMWKANRTPAQRQRHMVQGLIHEQLDRVNRGYFSIPETNYAARADYLNQHPELVRLWDANNNAADDYEAILHDANAELRQHFFNLLHEGKHTQADAFLAKHPFLWEDTKNADHYDPQTGQLKLQYLSAKAQAYMAAKPGFEKLDALMAKVGKQAAWNWLWNSNDPGAVAARNYINTYGKHTANGQPRSQHARDYLAAKPALDHYFSLPQAERSAWLRGNSAEAATVRAYFDKYGSGGGGGGRSQHALDYLAVRSILNAYFNMPKDQRETWLHGASPEAAQLRAYFAKWGSDKGMTQHARDYLAIKGALDHYFSLSKTARRAWLNGGSKDAKAVLAYFKKYGTTHKYERAYAKLDPNDVGGTPEQRQRLLFWKRYFALNPAERPNFIHNHAAQYGVFIYGPLAETARDEQEQAWLRRAHGAHFTQHQLDYLYVKPLLDFYFKLPSGPERTLFMQDNPELYDYFQAHPPKVSTGNAKTDKLVEAYFKLPVTDRSAFLAAHPEVQRYFDKTSTPAQRAIHSLLSQFFALTGHARKDFGASHPEIAAYFAAKRLEQANQTAVAQAFYEADPHLAAYRREASQMIGSAQRQLDRLRAQAIQSFTPDAIEANRDRSTYKGHSKGRHVARAAKSDVGDARDPAVQPTKP